MSLGIIGPVQAAEIITVIGNIANFDRVSKLRSYFGWAPRQAQSGSSLDVMSLSRGGNHSLKRIMCLVAWGAIRFDSEWRLLYERLVPIKCSYDERIKRHRGKMKVVGRICGGIISVIYTLLRQDYELMSSLGPGEEAPPPILYSREIHHAHRTR